MRVWPSARLYVYPLPALYSFMYIPQSVTLWSFLLIQRYREGGRGGGKLVLVLPGAAPFR